MRGFNPDETAWSGVQITAPGGDSEQSSRNGRVLVGDQVPVFVGVQEVPQSDHPLWGKIEFNPSRVLDPDGCSLAPVHTIPAMVEMVFEAVDRELVTPMCDPAAAKVKRLDVARDFTGVDRPDFYLRGLAPVKRPWARRNLVHFDPQRRGAQTLMVGSGSGIVRLYDKHAETAGQAPPGTLRWETEARQGWCCNYGDGMRTVADVNEERVATLAENRWEWSAMGVEVSASERVLEVVQRSGLSPMKKQRFVGWLMFRCHGMEAPISNDSAAEFNRLVRQLGITLGPDTFGSTDGAAFTARLDWETGEEILRAA